MRNRIGRVRHLTLVPDLVDGPDSSEPEIADDTFTNFSAGYGAPVARYTIRVTLDGVEPAVWRRFEVRSDLLLPEFHQVLQQVMGWKAVHPHRYRLRKSVAVMRYDFETTVVEAGSVINEQHVRLDSVLDKEGDVIGYEYDFGDGWTHTVELESLIECHEDLRTLCLDGAHACPPENSGGPVGYRHLLDVLADPGHAEYESVRETAGPFDPEQFEVARVNDGFRAGAPVRSAEVEAAVASQLIARLFGTAQPEDMPALLSLLPRCELTIESSVDLPVATVAMKKLSWLLELVGDTGLRLTPEGQFPPAAVEAMRVELDWGLGWIGSSLREVDNHQVADLRNAAKRLGLVRVFKGALVRTKAGTRYAEDPVGLWRHCASRIPLGKEAHEIDGGTLFLVALASSASATQRNTMIVETMQALGWGTSHLVDAHTAAQPTVDFLDLIGAHGPSLYFRSEVFDAPSWSRRFARDALRS